MPARLLTGKEPADALLHGLRRSIEKLQPSLTIVQVGDDPASDAYIKRKVQACADLSIRCSHKKLPATISTKELLDVIEELNTDAKVTGFLLQLPLPETLWKDLPLLSRAIDPKKDVDGFTAYNLGKVFLSQEFEHLPPATPAGIIELLTHYKIAVEGKHSVIVGRSNLVGKPLAVMLLNRSATVTVCHSKTKDLAFLTRQADILICAVGQPNLIGENMVKPGAVVIDVGITRTDEGLIGDIDVEVVKEVACAITPVPGGVGPLTVACLLRNVVRAAERLLPLPLPQRIDHGADGALHDRR